MEDCFRRWQSMARRVSNSLVQWAHLKPRARGAFLTGRLSWPVGRIKQETSLLGPVIFLGQLAGRCREETCSKEIRTNEKQSICSVMRIARAASATELCLSHGKCENLLQNRPHVSVDMTTWKGIQHTIQNILCNNKKDCTLAQWPHEKCPRKIFNFFLTCGLEAAYNCISSCNDGHAAKTKKPSRTVWPAMWYA